MCFLRILSSDYAFWSESSLAALYIAKNPSLFQADNKVSYQTAQIRRADLSPIYAPVWEGAFFTQPTLLIAKSGALYKTQFMHLPQVMSEDVSLEHAGWKIQQTTI